MRFAPATLRSKAARRFDELFPRGSHSARSQSYLALRRASQPDLFALPRAELVAVSPRGGGLDEYRRPLFSYKEAKGARGAGPRAIGRRLKVRTFRNQSFRN